MTAAIGSSCDVSGAAHLPAAVAALLPASEVAGAGGAVTALRLEGFAPSVRHRERTLQALAQPFGEVATIAEGTSQALWRAIRDVAPLAANPAGADRPLWRVSTAPTRGEEVAAMVADRDRRADAVRLGWRPGVAGAGAVRRCRRGRDSPCRCGGRRARDAHPGAGCGARGHRGVRPAGCRACCVEQAGQGELRSEGRAQSGTNVGGGVINGSIADHVR